MIIKFGEIVKGNEFMYRSSGASTIYIADNVTKDSEHTTIISAISKLSKRKFELKKINSVRVILFN